MSEDERQEVVIVRRRVEGEDDHHGGAWKIAYADFVTAMMAFFLVLWILSSTNKDQQTIIARYFNPVKLEDFSKHKKGIRETRNPDENPGAEQGNPAKSPPPSQRQGRIEERGKNPNKKFAAQAVMDDETLFRNPYAALDQIAGKAPTEQGRAKNVAEGEAGEIEAFRNPFKPSGAVNSEPPMAPRNPGKAQAQAPAAKAQMKSAVAEKVAPKPVAAAPQSAPAQAKPQTAVTKASAVVAAKTAAKAKEAAATAEKAAKKAEADNLSRAITQAMKTTMGARTPDLDVKETNEGVLISLTDSENFGMFAIGSASPNPKLVHLMDRIARILKKTPGRIVLRGYTDARPYHGGDYDNWRLSASRAQMALYMLKRGGVPESRIEAVEGFAGNNLKRPDNPDAAENRRIEILLCKAAS